MSANRACFPIAVMARVLGVSKAGYYAWRHRPPSAHARADEVLLARIKTVHISSRQTYGAPRVHAELRAAGERHGRKRIARLMRVAGLVGASRRRGGPITTQRDKHARPAPDPGLRRGRFWWTATFRQPARTSCGSPTSPRPSPGQALRPDRGGLPLSGGRRGCLEPQGGRLGDGKPPASRAGSGHPEHGPRPASAARRDPSFRPEPAPAKAGGSQYTSLAFGRRCKKAGVRPSMGSVGDAYDNALCESFFATLECELLERRRFASQIEARMACFSFIEGFYNPTRRHSALGYRSPICYEQEMQTDRQSATP